MMVKLETQSKSVLHLFTRLCAIIGGIWCVLGLAYSFTRVSVETLKKSQKKIAQRFTDSHS